jgi:isoaspartyl peptidase/L-asparaginase-like protein (Ntn-hydrolase superfamily)
MSGIALAVHGGAGSIERDENGRRGGLVAVDAAGRVAAPFTTRGKVRGWIGAEGAPRVRLFADE